MPPKRIPTDLPLVADLATALLQPLGDQLVGLYLYGSAVSGGFDPDVSDLDFIAITACPANELDLRQIAAALAQVEQVHPAWVGRVEIVYVGEATLGSFRGGGSLVVVSPGEPLHLTEGADLWTQNWYLARRTSLALHGPAPATIFPPVTTDEFLDSVVRYAAEVRARDLAAMSPGGRAYTVLTMCRALRTVATRTPGSKQQAARWVRRRKPQWAPLIDAALACRASGGETGLDDQQSLATARLMVDALAEEIALTAIA